MFLVLNDLNTMHVGQWFLQHHVFQIHMSWQYLQGCVSDGCSRDTYIKSMAGETPNDRNDRGKMINYLLVMCPVLTLVEAHLHLWRELISAFFDQR